MTRRKQRWTIILALVLLFQAVWIIQAAGPYPDVDEKNPDYYGILYNQEHHFISARESGEFKPDESITRAELIMALYQMAGSPKAEGSSFSDVPAASAFSQPGIWSRNICLYEGDDSNLFQGDESLTRQQAIDLLYRYASLVVQKTELGNYLDPDHDYSAASLKEYQKAVNWAVSNNLIRYDLEGSYITGYHQLVNPDEPASRGWVCTLIQNYLDGGFLGDPLPDQKEFQGLFSINTELSEKYARGRYNPANPDCLSAILLDENGRLYIQYNDGRWDGGSYVCLSTNSQTRIEVCMQAGFERASTWNWPCALLDGQFCILTSNGILSKDTSLDPTVWKDPQLDSLFDVELSRTIPENEALYAEKESFITRLELSRLGIASYTLKNGYQGFGKVSIANVSSQQTDAASFGREDLLMDLVSFDLVFDQLNTGEKEFENIRAKAQYSILHPDYQGKDETITGNVFELSLNFEDPQINELFNLEESSLAYYSATYLNIESTPEFFEPTDLHTGLDNLDFFKFYTMR